MGLQTAKATKVYSIKVSLSLLLHLVFFKPMYWCLFLVSDCRIQLMYDYED